MAGVSRRGGDRARHRASIAGIQSRALIASMTSSIRPLKKIAKSASRALPGIQRP